MQNDFYKPAIGEITIFPSGEPYMYIDSGWSKITQVDESCWHELRPTFEPTSLEPFRCECCGAPLHIKAGTPATVCEYCGNAYIWR